MIVRRTRETVLMGNTIIICVVNDTSVIGLEVDTVISCLDDCVKSIAPTPNTSTLQTSHLQTLNSINDVNIDSTFCSFN